MEQQDREVEQLANFICEKLRNSDSEEKIKELESLNFNLISEIAFELGYGISDMLRTPLLTREGMHAISKIGKRIRECRKEILKKKFQEVNSKQNYAYSWELDIFLDMTEKKIIQQCRRTNCHGCKLGWICPKYFFE